MRISTFSSLCLTVSLIHLGCSVNKNQLKKILAENPDIIFEAIEKNPGKYLEMSQKVQLEARKIAQEKQMEDMKKERDEDIKNPKVPEVSEGRAMRGPKDAPVLVVEYSDFECPYCSRGFNTVEEIRKKYGDKIRFMFKHLPLSFHKMAMPAAIRFEAIAMQNSEMAYKFHDEIFKNQSGLSKGEVYLNDLASKVGANVAKMKKDMISEIVKKRIEADMAEAQKFNISGTPGFIVAGVALRGAYPVEEFVSIIDQKLGASSDNRGVANK